MKIRVIYSDKEYWEDFDPEQIDEVVFTPFAYFNVFMKMVKVLVPIKLMQQYDE